MHVKSRSCRSCMMMMMRNHFEFVNFFLFTICLQVLVNNNGCLAWMTTTTTTTTTTTKPALSPSLLSSTTTTKLSSRVFSKNGRNLMKTNDDDDDENNNDNINNGCENPIIPNGFINRRNTLLKILSSSLLLSSSSSSYPALAAAAAEDTVTATTTISDLFLRLRSIPTFSLVTPEGVPFMIFDGRASATGYFFLSLDVAVRALEDARTKDKTEGASEIWKSAQIIVVPLAVALQLSLRNTQRVAVNNDIKFNTYNDVVASVEGTGDAKEIENNNGFVNNNPEKWAKGRVPLFYIDGMTLSDGREPRYFNKYDLIQEWKKQQQQNSSTTSTATLPTIQLVEMVDLYRQALAKNDVDKLSNLVIVPVAETNAAAKKLLAENTTRGIPTPKYDFNKVFLVGTAK